MRLLQFPDNDDPDSYSRRVSQEEFHDYLANNTVDFLDYKSKQLKQQAKNDPVKKAEVVRDLVENIALIPDGIIRSIYIKTCASNMEMEEQVLQQEVNKLRRKAASKGKTEPAQVTREEELPPEEAPPEKEEPGTGFRFAPPRPCSLALSDEPRLDFERHPHLPLASCTVRPRERLHLRSLGRRRADLPCRAA